MAEIRSIGFRVYLEGILLPEDAIQAIQVNVRPGAPKSFQVMLPPLRLSLLRQIRPRTHIAVFFKDDAGSQSEFGWRLLVEGEVVGYRFSKSARGSISAVLLTEGIENYWEYTYALHFQSAKSLTGSNLHDNKVVFGTAGRVLTLDFPGGNNPIPLQDAIKAAIDASPDAKFPEIFIDLFKGIEKLSPFFADATDRLHLGRRLSFVPDDEIGSLVSAKNASDLLGATFNQYPQDARLITIMQTLMSNVHYGSQSIVAPPFINGRPAEFVIKPDLPFIAPPRCNSIFPGQSSQFSFGRTYLREPTRARISMPTLVSPNSPMFRKHYYAPKEMEGVVRAARESSEGDFTIESLLMTGDDLRAESREDIKGVIPLVSVFPGYEGMALGGVSEESRDEYFSQLTEYNLQLEQHAPRVMEIAGPFNPMVVCGFPGVVVMEYGVVFGVIQSVAHSVHAVGGATTQIVMTHCREDDLSELTPPSWKNSRFTDRDRIDQTYADLLGQGHGSIMAPVQGLSDLLDTRFRSQTVAGQRLKQAHASMGEQEEFEREYTRRPIATLQELFGFLGGISNGRDYESGAFRKGWQEAAKLVASELLVRVQDAR